MPPTGPLRPEQVAIIRNWINQGADWPDSLANEADLPPTNPKAEALIEMLRTGNTRSFLRALKQDPKLVNARGPGCATPFMFAVLYGTSPMLEHLIKIGADVNARNDVNATALLWAAVDFDKTRVLLRHGPDVNARSDDLRTSLMVAARRPGGEPVVKALLDRGAKLNRTQEDDGTWHVKSRSLAFQPYFETGFPHGYDQSISAVATSWSTMALALSMPPAQSAQARGK